MIRDRIQTLENAYEELKQLAEDRKSRLNESRKLWQFYWDMADEEGWIREKEQLMSTPDLGHDLTSVHLLLNKQKVGTSSYEILIIIIHLLQNMFILHMWY